MLKSRKEREGNDEKHLAALRRCDCCICGSAAPNTVHHLKATGQRGVAMKSPDRFGLPMCLFPRGNNCHGEIESIGSKHELEWFLSRGIDALLLAAQLWRVTRKAQELGEDPVPSLRAAILLHRAGVIRR